MNWLPISNRVDPPNTNWALTKLQFESLFSGLDWRRIKVPKTRIPRAAE
jgi:hypothetical protein